MTDHLVSCACTECSFRALCEEQARTIADLVAERDALKGCVDPESADDCFERVMRELAEANAVLAVLEWVWDGPGKSCPICDRAERDAHTPDCRLARCLGRETR